MEAAGLAVGIAGLASLFKACSDIIKLVESYKTFGLDASITKAKYDSAKALFFRWGRTVGLATGDFDRSRLSPLENDSVAGAARQILNCIHALFLGLENSGSKVLHNDINIPLSDSYHSALSKKKDGRSHNESTFSRFDKALWLLGKNRKVASQVEAFELLVSELHKLVPLDSDQTRKPAGVHALDTSVNLESILQELVIHERASQRKDIESAIASISTQDTFERRLRSRVSGTCQWILNVAKFKDWLSLDESSAKSKLLWIYGSAGFGKSVLSATLIHHFKAISGGNVVYFFCSADYENQRKPIMIIRSFLQQLLSQSPGESKPFRLFLEWMSGKSGPQFSDNECWELLRGILQTSAPSFLVIDGLDECSHSERDWKLREDYNRSSFLSSLKWAIAMTNARCLITSRPANDIRSSVLEREQPPGITADAYAVTLEDVSDDVIKYAKSLIEMKLPKKEEALKDLLTARLAEKSEGMFLWLRLQAEHLRGSKNRKQLLEAVSEMPTGLERAFEQDWARIIQLAPRDRDRALNILRWITFALRPLSAAELSEALVIPDSNNVTELPVDEMPDVVDEDFVHDEIFGLCGSLLEFRDSDGSLPVQDRRIATTHFSIKEFLISKLVPELTLHDPGIENNYLAKICLRYLQYDEVWNSDEADQALSGKNKAFFNYAVKSWPYHISESGSNFAQVVELVETFFTPGNPYWEKWQSCFSGLDLGRRVYLIGAYMGGRLHFAARFGMTSVLKTLLDKYGYSIDAIQGRYGTALHAACMAGQLDCVKCLTERNADINIQGGIFGSTINAAAHAGSDDIITYLIAHGGDIAGNSSHGADALFKAVQKRSLNTVKLLLKKGCPPSTQHFRNRTALMLAVSLEDVDIVDALVRHGADVNAKDQKGDTALHKATANADILRLLLESGADASLANRNGNSPFHVAVKLGHLSATKTFLQFNSHPSMRNEHADTPMHLAAFHGHLGVLKLLLERGADDLTPGSDNLTPLDCAIIRGNLDVVDYLVNHSNQSVDALSDNRLLLHHAAFQGSLEVARLLLQRGLDPSARGRTGLVPLHFAAKRGHKEIIQLLLDHGVDPNIYADSGESPLYSALMHGHQDCAQTLLSGGADVDPSRRDLKIPLFAAFSIEDKEMISMLLKRGADIRVRDWRGKNVLHFLCSNWNFSLLEAFLRPGVIEDLLVPDLLGRTVLHHAAISEDMDGIAWAINQGINPNVRDNQEWTPLHWAAYLGNEGAVHRLQQLGADKTISDMHHLTPSSIASMMGTSLLIVSSLRPSKTQPDLRKLSFKPLDGFCDCCDQQLREPMYHCKTCKCFDLCFRCGLDWDKIHSQHAFRTDFCYDPTSTTHNEADVSDFYNKP